MGHNQKSSVYYVQVPYDLGVDFHSFDPIAWFEGQPCTSSTQCKLDFDLEIVMQLVYKQHYVTLITTECYNKTKLNDAH